MTVNAMMVRRRFFHHGRAAAKAEEEARGAATKQQQPLPVLSPSIFRRLAGDDGSFPVSPTANSDVTELSSTSTVTILTTGSYTYDKPLLDSLAEIHDLKIELHEMKQALQAKDEVIASQREEISRHLRVADLEIVEDMELELNDLEEALEAKDEVIASQQEEITRLRVELTFMERQLAETKSTLTMKQLELNARKQDVLDKDGALLLVLAAKKRNDGDENNPIDALVGLGLNIVGHLPFVQL